MKKFATRVATAVVIGAAALSGTAVAGAAETPTAETTAPTAGTTAPATGEKYDLEPAIRVAGGKVPGYAGLVSVSAVNVGTEDYYAEFPAITFRIEVKTESGPQGVDRLITPGYFNGAYTRDLGFDRATSTRTFEVTLSNPIEAGEGRLIANLNFGDGATKKGRIVNYITVTQVGRLADDKSTGNDQNIDSREVTKTDTGRSNKGLF
ncbi:MULTISPECIES: hypothetical protein [Corynebacterium]|uniref:Neuraminidase n=1 Tax=Corynebacterium auriscanis TaxID=99807 RepID=A0A0A2DM96_9CORY|nr:MULTISPECIES: hypothetical protein [Corynebacterium]KGM19034.1 hypothetical protein MA47_02010 [Corynebacterium auriscanis]OFT87345.1 hypothetical protein HMPREF3098_09720 [Corynebacterium sp. HMSC28B08]WJY72210.1 hypothetical protein CAURIC_02720 [Corynebacterium auriscanis]